MQKTIIDFKAAKEAIEKKTGKQITNLELYKMAEVEPMTAYNLQKGKNTNIALGIALRLSAVSGLPLKKLIKPLKK